MEGAGPGQREWDHGEPATGERDQRLPRVPWRQGAEPPAGTGELPLVEAPPASACGPVRCRGAVSG
jgi:hypothetical protein